MKCEQNTEKKTTTEIQILSNKPANCNCYTCKIYWFTTTHDCYYIIIIKAPFNTNNVESHNLKKYLIMHIKMHIFNKAPNPANRIHKKPSPWNNNCKKVEIECKDL